MKFSILVPTMGTRKDELNRFFESLSLQNYDNFEIVVVSQINHIEVEELVFHWSSQLTIKHIKLEKAGLSYARNQGLPYCDGEWVILSDDDAWYPNDGLKKLYDLTCSGNFDILLTQIFDPYKKELYKDYSKEEKILNSKFQLMSKSSIEIAFKKEAVNSNFDEKFGLGAEYVCGEEIDFLLKNFNKDTIKYYPCVTVYHLKKYNETSKAQIKAKGALYAKHYNYFIAFLISVRDFLKRRSGNKIFWQGFKEYKKHNSDI